jgi:hypothetical protein
MMRKFSFAEVARAIESQRLSDSAQASDSPPTTMLHAVFVDVAPSVECEHANRRRDGYTHAVPLSAGGYLYLRATAKNLRNREFADILAQVDVVIL